MITNQCGLVSLPEAAVMIRACVRTVYRLIDDGSLPKQVKIRSRSFLSKSAVNAYLKDQGLEDE